MSSARDRILAAGDDAEQDAAEAFAIYLETMEAEQVQAFYDRIKKHDPSRPVWLNLGQGIANEAFKGRGAKPSDYPGYAAACDILSFDVYPVANLKRPQGEDYLWFLAKGLGRLKKWGGEDKPLWNFIECTSIHDPALKATPTQVESEVWMSLIHGSRGIVWFVHQFQPELRTAALFDDPEMMEAVGRINREILAMAPVLNAPESTLVVEVKSDEAVPVSFTTRSHDGWTYLFAIGMRNASTEASFSVGSPDSLGGAVEVLGEDRTIEAAGGGFQDSFGPFQVHHYRWKASR